MRFHVIMGKTIGELLSLKRTITIVAVGLAAGVGLYFLMWQRLFESGDMSLEMQTSSLIGYFLIISFMFLAGIYLAYIIGLAGLEFVAKEEERGTLLLMVSKPVSRFQFLLGKFLALLLTSLLLELIVLLGSVLLLGKLLELDPDILEALLGLVPWTLLFSVIVGLLFAAISIAASALIKSDTIRSLLLMVVIMLIFGIGPMLRTVSPNAYESYHLYYVDGSYNLGNAYELLLNQAESGRMTPQIQALSGMFTGGYKTGATELILTMFLGSSESFDPDIGAMLPSLEQTEYLNPVVSILLSLAIAAAALGVAKVAMERKEVF
ncbi:MAG: hypothetical protein COS88_03835 [Chloroflexi bacterium CG07_land_8_20_14_0_80_51_10]|nr:MAG: hypothetical protein COS88_03835 [Chloroflexi bacterium CG07_land_8_20_14_0_80_51_10]